MLLMWYIRPVEGAVLPLSADTTLPGGSQVPETPHSGLEEVLTEFRGEVSPSINAEDSRNGVVHSQHRGPRRRLGLGNTFVGPAGYREPMGRSVSPGPRPGRMAGFRPPLTLGPKRVRVVTRPGSRPSSRLRRTRGQPRCPNRGPASNRPRVVRPPARDRSRRPSSRHRPSSRRTSACPRHRG